MTPCRLNKVLGEIKSHVDKPKHGIDEEVSDKNTDIEMVEIKS